jgi:hypothetical protein
MGRKLLLTAAAAVSLAVLVPSPAPAVHLGRACAGIFQRTADYGCEFNVTGARLRVVGVALDDLIGPNAKVTVWVTATPNPTAEALLRCTAPVFPGATACRDSARTELIGATLYCWASGTDRGIFACSS